MGFSACYEAPSKRKEQGLLENKSVDKITPKKEKEKIEETTEPLILKDGITKHYNFDLRKTTYSIDLQLSESELVYFNRQPRAYRYTGNRLPKNWERDYYDMFLKHRQDDRLFELILKELRALQNESENKNNKTTLLELVVAFVQGSVKYDWDSYYSITDKLKYPYETVFRKRGVCSDKTLVLAKLLEKLDYDFGFFLFSEANHMALGIKVPNGYGNFNTNYAFIESTGYNNIGYIPENYNGDVKLDSHPEFVLPTYRGRKVFKEIIAYKRKEYAQRKKYGAGYMFGNAEQKQLLEEMYNLKQRQGNLHQQLTKLGCKGRISKSKAEKCNKTTEDLNALIDLYNQKVNAYNALNEEEAS